MQDSISKSQRLIYGLLLPLLSLIAGLLLVMALESRAGAAEFASLGIMLVSITVIPLTLILNGLIALRESPTKLHCYRRGMILPALMIAVALLYQLGLTG